LRRGKSVFLKEKDKMAVEEGRSKRFRSAGSPGVGEKRRTEVRELGGRKKERLPACERKGGKRALSSLRKRKNSR